MKYYLCLGVDKKGTRSWAQFTNKRKLNRFLKLMNGKCFACNIRSYNERERILYCECKNYTAHLINEKFINEIKVF